MQIIDYGTWVKLTSGTGMDLQYIDGFRAKNISCPVSEQANWIEVPELAPEPEYTSTELTIEDRLFLQSLRFDFEATKNYVGYLLGQQKITLDQYNAIANKMIDRRDAIAFYRAHKTTMTIAQLKTCLDKII